MNVIHRNRIAVVKICLAAGLLVATAGCSFRVDKSNDGKDKNVKIETPLGGIHVTSDGTVAADMGLPTYPGAKVMPEKDGDKSVDVHMGFGDWQFRLKVVGYETSDPPEKVVAFYKKALGRYGDVIECQNEQAVGKPAVTSEGLTCKNDGSKQAGTTKVNLDEPHALKAGSPRHQHIVGIKPPDGKDTKFGLVQLDLPGAMVNSKSESD